MSYFVAILLALAIELRASTSLSASLQHRIDKLCDRTPLQWLPAITSCLLLTLIVQLFLIADAAHALERIVPFVATLPVPVASTAAPLTVQSHPVGFVIRTSFALLAVVQAILTAMFILATQGRPWSRAATVVVAIAALASAAASLLAPATTSADMYAYVGDALLGPAHAYHPSGNALAAEFSSINQLWGRPLLPAAYGPIWLYWNAAVLQNFHSLGHKLFALKVENVALVACVIVALRRLALPTNLVAAIAISPPVWLYYVCTAHNDVLPVLLLLSAMLFVRRSIVFAAIVAGVGASMKLTLLIPALAVAVIVVSSRRRLIYCVATALLAALLGPVLGGAQYLRALRAISRKYVVVNEHVHGLAGIVHLGLAATVMILVAYAIWTIRRSRFVALGFGALTTALYPWYAIWGLPYAASRPDVLAVFIIGLPLIGTLMEPEMQSVLVSACIDAFLSIALIMTIVGTRGRSASDAST